MANEEHLAILEQGVEVWNRWREEHPNITPDLRKANLLMADLSGADLSDANFREADLSVADLHGADLREAKLIEAKLIGANLTEANLRGANLFAANLSYTIFDDVDLTGADLSGAYLYHTVFADVDLSQTHGLDQVTHKGPSTIGIDTLYRSGGNIPESFLRGCGVPDQFIEYARALVGKAIEYYSCFISYSSKDEECAQRLHADLQVKNVRCWFAPHDMAIGARIRPTIDDAIRLHDKLLLILSEASVESQWVEQEVERAMQKERDSRGSTVLFPIRLDDAVMHREGGWPNYLRNTRNIGDFTRWKDHDAYQQAFQRLLRDLKATS